MSIKGNAESQFEKLPSFMAYCKSKGKEAEGKLKVVATVWFPNKFPNFSLDTESYRLRVPSKGSDAIEITDFLETAIDEGKVLAVRCDSTKDYAYEVLVLENESGAWEQIGESGWKCTVQDRPKQTSSRRSRSKANVSP